MIRDINVIFWIDLIKFQSKHRILTVNDPTSQPSSEPSNEPSNQPSNQPIVNPTSNTIGQPTMEPTSRPSNKPSGSPSTTEPSSQPTLNQFNPSGQPTSLPTVIPSDQPSSIPSRQPSQQPSSTPSRKPSNQPSLQPTREPSVKPSQQPTSSPTHKPSNQPSHKPSSSPISEPTYEPTTQPTTKPSKIPTPHPSVLPTFQPTISPTVLPTFLPTKQPTYNPTTTNPTILPTFYPSQLPTNEPTQLPTTFYPSVAPTTEKPQMTSTPTFEPTYEPSISLYSDDIFNHGIGVPTRSPVNNPTTKPTISPSFQPTFVPSFEPSDIPTNQPTFSPTIKPTILNPTPQPNNKPTGKPVSSIVPSSYPTSLPTSQPSAEPTNDPTRQPISKPTTQPTNNPTSHPTSNPTQLPRIIIAGFFNVFTEDGEVDNQSLQQLSAFTLAINEINSNADLLNNYVLEYIIRSAYTSQEASEIANEIMNIPNVIAVVNSLPLMQTTIINYVLSDPGLLVVTTTVIDTSLTMGIFPYNIQMTAVDANEGQMIQQFQCLLNAKRVIMFTTNDDYGTKASLETTNNQFCSLNNLATYTFDSSITDFSNMITQALLTDGNVYILYMNDKNAAMLLEQGYNLGLFRVGTTIILGSKIITNNFYSYFTGNIDIPTIMKGSIYFQYTPNYALETSIEGDTFVTNYRKQTSTLNNCANFRDYTNNYYLFHNSSMKAQGLNCAGLQFNKFQSTGSDLADYVPHNYDAVYTIAYSLQFLMDNPTTLINIDKVNKNLNVQTTLSIALYLRDIIINNITFYGASGYIDIISGTVDTDSNNNIYYYKRGARETGQYYKIYNFNLVYFFSKYYNVTLGFGYVAIISSTESFKPCNKLLATSNILDECNTLITNTFNGRIPNGYPAYAFQNAPKIIKIGGFFSPFNENNELDLVQQENLAAFVMAINEINNNPKILGGKTIVFTINSANNYYESTLAGINYINSFYNSGIYGLVSGLFNEPVIGLTSLLSNSNNIHNNQDVVIINSLATDSVLNNSTFGNQIIPLDSKAGEVIQEILCDSYYYHKITVFQDNSIFGIDAFSYLINNKYCELTILSNYIFSNEQIDFQTEIENAKQIGSTVFVLLTYLTNAAHILTQGYELNLFVDGTQVFCNHLIIDTQLPVIINQIISANDNSNDDITINNNIIKTNNILKGLIGLQYWPEYSLQILNKTVTTQNFLNNWNKQNYTGSTISGYNNKLTCNKQLDDAGIYFLYQSSNGSVCSGLNYSSYSTSYSASYTSTITENNELQSIDEKLVNPHALLTYDATYALAYAFNFIYLHNMELTSNNLQLALINNVSFAGASGYVRFHNDQTGQLNSINKVGHGNRYTGLYYKVLNYQFVTDTANNNNSYGIFEQIGTWHSERGVISCLNLNSNLKYKCKTAIYRTVNNAIPSDSQPNKYISFPLVLSILTFTCSIAILVLSMVILFVLIYYHKRKLIKASQPVMNNFILLGILLGGVKILIIGLPINDNSCIAGLWFGHLSYVSAFGSLFLKTYRVHVLINNPSLKRIKFTTFKVFAIMTSLIVFMIFWLLLLTFIGKPHRSYINSVENNQTISLIKCSYVYPQFLTLIYCLEALLMLIGARLIYATRNVPASVNESKNIAIGKY